MKFTSLKKVSRGRALMARVKSMAPRRRIILLAGMPMALMTVWALFSAMSAPKIEPEIARDVAPLRDIYSDPMYSLYGALGLTPDMNRGNIDAQTQALAMAHLDKHAKLTQDLLTSYKRDLLLAGEVETLRALARKEIEEGTAMPPTDKVGDLNFQTCLESGIQHEDCIYLRFMGDGLVRMRNGHEQQNYQLFIDGERVYMAALAALGDAAVRSPDFSTTKQTLKTYRAAIHDVIDLNKMWIGEIDRPLATIPPVTPDGVEARINKTLGD
ncbi:MAG: hypothetical protein AAF821_18100 [Cyanobacteria bacterium P01_D01_bin.156]